MKFEGTTEIMEIKTDRTVYKMRYNHETAEMEKLTWTDYVDNGDEFVEVTLSEPMVEQSCGLTREGAAESLEHWLSQWAHELDEEFYENMRMLKYEFG